MSCIAVHVDTKVTEFEIAMQISFLKIFRKKQLQETITASLLFIYFFIHCILCSIIPITFYSYLNIWILWKRYINNKTRRGTATVS